MSDAVTPDNDGLEVEAASAIARDVSDFLTQVDFERYGPSEQNDFDVFNLAEFVEHYVSGRTYPIDRLKEATLRLVDLRLQLEYIEFDLGLMNTFYYSHPNYEQGGIIPAKSKLAKMALEQSVIGRIRIAWEKLFRLIYFLETGKPEISGHRVKRIFFKWVDTTAKWRFLTPYEAIVEAFDARYRTPEYHKHSVVRGQLVSGKDLDLNDVLTPLNYLKNTIWPNLISILNGRTAAHFTDLHEVDQFKIDPRYLTVEQQGEPD
ncbi:hypothetical protein ACFXGA_15980 [Actinosynnema sp. NPDC059335]|uniref:hypothetical protein n=1 Tax=Actinosynnema sp. NPDC059335 TaxID=3346804 RepID=UPI003672420F